MVFRAVGLAGAAASVCCARVAKVVRIRGGREGRGEAQAGRHRCGRSGSSWARAAPALRSAPNVTEPRASPSLRSSQRRSHSGRWGSAPPLSLTGRLQGGAGGTRRCFQVSCPRHRLAPLVGGLPLRRCGVGVRGTAEDRASWLRPTLEAPRALSVVRERV